MIAATLAGVPRGWAGGAYADDSPESPNVRFGIIALTDDEQIYLVGQYRYPTGTYSWELVSGYCEPGEELLERSVNLNGPLSIAVAPAFQGSGPDRLKSANLITQPSLCGKRWQVHDFRQLIHHHSDRVGCKEESPRIPAVSPDEQCRLEEERNRLALLLQRSMNQLLAAGQPKPL